MGQWLRSAVYRLLLSGIIGLSLAWRTLASAEAQTCGDAVTTSDAAAPAASAPMTPVIDASQWVRPGYTLIDAESIDLRGDGTTQIVVLSYSTGAAFPPATVDVFTTNPAGDAPTLIFTDSLNTYRGPDTKMLAVSLTTDGRHQFAVYQVAGSGAYLAYRVYGYENQSLQVLLDRAGIFQGSIRATTNGLIEDSSDRHTLFVWNGNALIGTPLIVQSPVPADTVFLRYRVTETKVTGPSHVDLRIGQRMELVREDDLPDSTRILMSGVGIVSEPGSPSAVCGTQVGAATVTIIPRGYDWDNALSVQISVDR